MKPINPLKRALKQVKVEGSDIIRKPVDAVARRVVMPRAWWADPIPEKPAKTADVYEAELTNLRGVLKEERQAAAQSQKAAYGKIMRLEEEVAQLKAKLAEFEQEGRAALREHERIMKSITEGFAVLEH